MDLVGRHHDPFTVMRLFDAPLSLGASVQPVTDITGALIARVTGVVAAVNWMVLTTFPLAAAAAFLLARHLGMTTTSAAIAALAFAFSPFHMAQAAYHPHIAQVQWLPLYFLALWRGLDDASPASMAMIAIATIGVTFSNLYGGLIAAVLTPTGMLLYWLTRSRGQPRALRHVLMTSATLLTLVAIAWLGLRQLFPGGLGDPMLLRFADSDPFKYSAKWWSYLVPPIAHPWLGTVARGIWDRADVHEGLLEQQVTLGVGLILLALVAVLDWTRHRRATAAHWAVPMLAIIAVVALVCSLSPERTIAGVTIARPSALLFKWLPMFRSFARFGSIVQLMTALLAGIGVTVLWQRRGAFARAACVACLLLAASEYIVSPASMSRDVLPTSAHRWLMKLPGTVHALDCTPLTQESESVQWLTHNRVTMAGGDLGDCLDARIGDTLAQHGYTHLLVRADDRAHLFLASPPPVAGLRLEQHFADADVFAVTRRREHP